MALMVGVLLGIAVGLFGTGTGFDRDRSFYPVIMVVIASYYALFAVMGASTQTLIVEVLAGAVFVAAAVAGFKSSLWIAAAAIAVHGFTDFGHTAVIPNPGVPAWWPAFCASIDITLAAYLAWQLGTGRRSPTLQRDPGR